MVSDILGLSFVSAGVILGFPWLFKLKITLAIPEANPIQTPIIPQDNPRITGG
jgi:hypothetical protein